MITDDSRRLTRQTRSAKVWVQMVLDHIVVQSLLVLHTILRTDDDAFPVEYRVLAVVTFLLMTLIYNALGVYRHEYVGSDYFSSLLQGWGSLVLLLGMFGFVSKTSETFSREVILTWSVTGFVGQYLVYMLVQRVLSGTIRETIPTAVVGNSDLARHIASHINDNQWIPEHVVGYFGTDSNETEWSKLSIPRLGGVDDVIGEVVNHGVRRVYIALPMSEAASVEPLSEGLIATSIDVIWAPDIFGTVLVNHSIREIAGAPLISLSETPMVGGAALAKTMMDKSLALIALILISPLMLLTALLIKVTSPGPVFFKQRRHGWDGRILEIWKFRSMKVHEEKEGHVTQATKDDDRITAIGRFIRRTSIDELPQLFNILDGSMSLVGPRPHAVAHNDFYRGKINSYMLRHRVKPGLTGLAQVNGFRGETDTMEKMQNRVNYDLAYINNWSLWLDIEIMFRTVFVIFGKNAY